MLDPHVKQEYTLALQQFRQQKDAFFAQAAESPLSSDQRLAFNGLQYFAPDLAYRVIAKVEYVPAGDVITMQTTDNATRQFERYARLRFTLDDTECTLTGYRSLDAEELLMGDDHVQLFVPFRDALSGKQTYAAGRYMDVEVEQGEGLDPIVILDFNLAYNPYCAYNDLYSCPITPFENTLPVPVAAGEQSPH